MKLGIIGLGRTGSDMVRRLLRAGHECVVFDTHPRAALDLVEAGATATCSLTELVTALPTPRAIWIAVPVAAVESTIGDVGLLLDADDAVIDGTSTYYHDDIRRAKTLGERGIHYVDVGTSGVRGFERGYAQTIGGEPAIVSRLDRIFTALASEDDDATARSDGARRSYIYCGPPGAGHFAKMVHNWQEYRIMAAYAERRDAAPEVGNEQVTIPRYEFAGHDEKS